MIPSPRYAPHSLEDQMQDALFLTRLRGYGLLPAWKFVLDHNKAGDKNPYHNNYHTFQVARLADTLITLHGDRWWRSVVTAALFHDFNHSGGHESDAVNIERAVEGFRQFIEADLLGDLDLTPAIQEDIVALIRGTQFPWQDVELTVPMAVLRDADILSCVSQAGVWAVMKGLCQEMSVQRETPISRTQMLNQQLAFVYGTELHSPMGRVLWASLKSNYAEQCHRWAIEQDEAEFE